MKKLLLLLAVSLASCGGGGSSDMTTTPPVVTPPVVTPPVVTPPATFIMSGKITAPNGKPLSNVAIRLSGTKSLSTVSNAFGAFTFSVPTGSYTFTPSAVGMQFTPASITATSGNRSNLNFSRTPQSYASTQINIAMAKGLHDASMNAYTNDSKVLNSQLSAIGALHSGRAILEHEALYLRYVTQYVQVLTANINARPDYDTDDLAVVSLLASYKAQDRAYNPIASFSSILNASVMAAERQKIMNSVDSVYDVAIAQYR